MFKDMKMSDDLMAEFRQKPVYKNLTLELQMKVLTSGHWPNDQKDAQP
jgi:hypothetical protein